MGSRKMFTPIVAIILVCASVAQSAPAPPIPASVRMPPPAGVLLHPASGPSVNNINRIRWIFYERPDGIDAAAPEAIADHPRQPALEIQVKPPPRPPPHANDM